LARGPGVAAVGGGGGGEGEGARASKDCVVVPAIATDLSSSRLLFEGMDRTRENKYWGFSKGCQP